MFQKAKRIDMKPRHNLVDKPILILLIEKLLHESVEQHEVVVVTGPAVTVPAFIFEII